MKNSDSKIIDKLNSQIWISFEVLCSVLGWTPSPPLLEEIKRFIALVDILNASEMVGSIGFYSDELQQKMEDYPIDENA